jgi:hypothetical protein
MSSAERKRRYRERQRNGVVRIVVELDRLWAAEMLAAAGFLPSADSDKRETLQAATQELLETLIAIARDEGRVPQGLRASRYGHGNTIRKDQTP